MKKPPLDNHPPICLTIAGLDPSGGAGLIADVKTFSSFGCFAAAAISSVTFQNTTGVFGAIHQSGESVRRQVEAVLDDHEIAALKTGMLPTREIVEEVARVIGERGLQNVVVDPVIRSTTGADLIDDEALAALVEKLFPLAYLVTPNIPEAEKIAGMHIGSPEDINAAARTIRSMGAKSVLIKGGHIVNSEFGIRNAESGDRKATDHLFLGDDLQVFEAEFIETTATHGTGCVLSAAIAANLALGNDLAGSVKIAKGFVTEAIRTAPQIGKGNSPVNVCYFAGVKTLGV
jgi:hydroxymethylpyrimidine kinase/phosphomethylpyrimidine kinase